MKLTKIMGILNTTPDSLYENTRCPTLESAIAYGIRLSREGADLIDIGGESTRPYAIPISIEEEHNRVIPLIQELKRKIETPLSIDTMKPEVAAAAIEAGVSLLNDVTGFNNPEMREIAANKEIRICVMHMLGKPQTMQNNPQYEKGVVQDLLEWFESRIELLIRSGVKEKQIILDPGIGFGKTVADNLKILYNLPKFKAIGFPLLLGLSRKSFLGKIVNAPPTELLHATLIMNTVAITQEIDYIRVHDVKEHKQAVRLINALKTEEHLL